MVPAPAGRASSGLLVVVSVAFAAPFDFENPEHR